MKTFPFALKIWPCMKTLPVSESINIVKTKEASYWTGLFCEVSARSDIIFLFFFIYSFMFCEWIQRDRRGRSLEFMMRLESRFRLSVRQIWTKEPLTLVQLNNSTRQHSNWKYCYYYIVCLGSSRASEVKGPPGVWSIASGSVIYLFMSQWWKSQLT